MNVSYLTFLRKFVAATSYLLIGKEQFIKDDIVNIIKEKFKVVKREFTVTKIADWDEIICELNSLDMFATKKIFDIHYEIKTKDDVVSQVLQNTSENIIIIRSTNNIKSNSGAIIKATALNQQEFKQWVKHCLQDKTCDETIISEICDKFFGNMPSCQQLLKSLQNLEETQLTQKNVIPLLHDSATFECYHLSNAILEKKISLALRISEKLFLKSQHSLLLWYLSKDLRILYELQHYTKTMDILKACNKLKIWQSKIIYYKQKNITQKFLSAQFKAAAEADYLIKSGKNFLAEHKLKKIIIDSCL